jgi:hypothetical protein
MSAVYHAMGQLYRNVTCAKMILMELSIINILMQESAISLALLDSISIPTIQITVKLVAHNVLNVLLEIRIVHKMFCVLTIIISTEQKTVAFLFAQMDITLILALNTVKNVPTDAHFVMDL